MSKITVTVEANIPESALHAFLCDTLEPGVSYQVVTGQDGVVDFEISELHFHRETIHDSRTGQFASKADEQADPDHTVRES